MSRTREEWLIWCIESVKYGTPGSMTDNILSAITAARREAIEECAKVADDCIDAEADFVARQIRSLLLPGQPAECEHEYNDPMGGTAWCRKCGISETAENETKGETE